MVLKEEVAEFLLQKEYFLTALEFYQELLEDDGTELEQLKEFFIKQHITFEGESPRLRVRSRSGADEPGELSSKFKEKDDKIALLDYELRRAREDVSHLRSQLTSLVQGKKAAEAITDEFEKMVQLERDMIKEHELHTLNYLIRSYLIKNKYTLSAITFSEETSEELESWASVGLDTPEPPGLLSLYRIAFEMEDGGIQAALSRSMGTVAALSKKLTEREQEVKAGKSKIQNLQSQIEKLQAGRPAEAEALQVAALAEARASAVSSAATASASTTTSTSATATASVTAGGATAGGGSASSVAAASTAQQAVPAPAPEKVESAGAPKVEVSSVPVSASTPTTGSTSASSTTVTTTTTTTATTSASASAAAAASSAVVVSGQSQLTSRRVFKNMLSQKRINTRASTVAIDISSPESEASARIAQEVDKIMLLSGDAFSTDRILADCLPHIVPYVLLNARQELIPIILAVIRSHPEGSVRYGLTKLLFNLIKKPNEAQRRVIMNGCVGLATLIGPQRTDAELLTQCWEQINEKHPERRVLVADSCGALAEFVQPELRNSLILSILQQMLDDRSGLVREAVARNLSVLVNYFQADDKYAQVEALFIRLLFDSEADVVSTTRTMLLPSLANWADMIDVLHSRLFWMLLQEAQNTLDRLGAESRQAMSPLLPTVPKLEIVFESLLSLMQRLKESLLASSPFITGPEAEALEADGSSIVKSPVLGSPSTPAPPPPPPPRNKAPENSRQSLLSVLSSKQVMKLQQHLDQFLSSQPGAAEGVLDTAGWAMLDWAISTLVPKLLSLSLSVPPSQPQALVTLIELIYGLCSALGKSFTKLVVKRAFIHELHKPGSDTQQLTKKGRLLPVFVAGVLRVLDGELPKFLNTLICGSSVDDNGWDRSIFPTVKETIALICQKNFDRKVEVLAVLSELSSNPATQIRANVVALYNQIIPQCTLEEISKRVLPALQSLGSDPDRSVRFGCIAAYGTVVANVSDDLIVDKVGVVFEKLLQSDDDPHRTRIEVLHTFQRIVPNCRQRFRESFALPRMHDLVRKNSKLNDNSEQRKEMDQALLEAFRAFNSGQNSKDSIEEHIVPCLKLLLLDSPLIDSAYKSMCQAMLQDMESQLAPPTASTPQPADPKRQGQSGKGLFTLPSVTPTISMPNLPGASKISLPKWDWKNQQNNNQQ